MTTPLNEDPKNIFWEHLEEFRKTLIVIFFIIFSGLALALWFYDGLFHLLTYPLKLGKVPSELIIISPADGIEAVLKVAFWGSVACTSPLWLYCLLHFIHPALRRDEKRTILPFLFISLLFIAVGFLFGYFVTIPTANSYLIAFNRGIGKNLWTLNNYMDYTILLLLADALAFEFAVVLLFLIHLGALSVEFLVKWRKAAVVSILVLSAIITPPDVVSQILLAIPLILLYEGAVIFAKTKKRAP